MKEVFCSECKYLKSTGCISDPGYLYCDHPENYRFTKQTWYSKYYKRILRPRRRNKENNCNLFETK